MVTSTQSRSHFGELYDGRVAAQAMRALLCSDEQGGEKMLSMLPHNRIHSSVSRVERRKTAAVAVAVAVAVKV